VSAYGCIGHSAARRPQGAALQGCAPHRAQIVRSYEQHVYQWLTHCATPDYPRPSERSAPSTPGGVKLVGLLRGLTDSNGNVEAIDWQRHSARPVLRR